MEAIQEVMADSEDIQVDLVADSVVQMHKPALEVQASEVDSQDSVEVPAMHSLMLEAHRSASEDKS
jgi:hypothetical protein